MIREKENLAGYTSFKIGGPARYFAVCSCINELEELIDFAQEKDLSWFVLGGGSNVLINDSGFGGLVIKMEIKDLRVKDDLMICGSGALLAAAVLQALQNGLSGLEWALGIPGTVGGAVRGNAGAYGGEMKDYIASVEVLRGKEILTLKNSDCLFDYRESVFKKKGSCDIILGVALKLFKKNKKEIEERINRVALERDGKFGSLPSAGSIFKNIILTDEEMGKFKEKFPQLPGKFVSLRKIPAGWLIDQCGLKGKRIGGAEVSDLHAGIIVNIGSAKAQDIATLISFVKQKVRSKFNIQLFEEIQYLGF